MRNRQRNAMEMSDRDGRADAAFEIGGRLVEIAQQTNLLRLSLTVESAKPGADSEHIFGIAQKLEHLSRLISDAAGCTERLVSPVVDKGGFH